MSRDLLWLICEQRGAKAAGRVLRNQEAEDEE